MEVTPGRTYVVGVTVLAYVRDTGVGAFFEKGDRVKVFRVEGYGDGEQVFIESPDGRKEGYCLKRGFITYASELSPLEQLAEVQE